MSTALTRWLAPFVVAAGLGVAGFAPSQARASDADDLVRVIVDVADVIYHSGYPYYRYGPGYYDYRDRLIVVHDHYGRPVYYRTVPRNYYYRNGPPYGNAYGYYRNGSGKHRHYCDRYGRCRADYYDNRYDRRYYGYDRYRDYGRYYYRGDDRYWDGRRWRDHDDDD